MDMSQGAVALHFFVTTDTRQVKSDMQELQANLRTYTAELKLQSLKGNSAGNDKVLHLHFSNQFVGNYSVALFI